jgi:hypothetical protein
MVDRAINNINLSFSANTSTIIPDYPKFLSTKKTYQPKSRSLKQRSKSRSNRRTKSRSKSSKRRTKSRSKSVKKSNNSIQTTTKISLALNAVQSLGKAAAKPVAAPKPKVVKAVKTATKAAKTRSGKVAIKKLAKGALSTAAMPVKLVKKNVKTAVKSIKKQVKKVDVKKQVAINAVKKIANDAIKPLPAVSKDVAKNVKLVKKELKTQTAKINVDKLAKAAVAATALPKAIVLKQYNALVKEIKKPTPKPVSPTVAIVNLGKAATVPIAAQPVQVQIAKNIAINAAKTIDGVKSINRLAKAAVTNTALPQKVANKHVQTAVNSTKVPVPASFGPTQAVSALAVASAQPSRALPAQVNQALNIVKPIVTTVLGAVAVNNLAKGALSKAPMPKQEVQKNVNAIAKQLPATVTPTKMPFPLLTPVKNKNGQVTIQKQLKPSNILTKTPLLTPQIIKNANKNMKTLSTKVLNTFKLQPPQNTLMKSNVKKSNLV